MSKFKLVSVLLMAAAMVFTVAACGPSAEEEQETLNIAFVYDGPVGDHGYNYAHDLGRQAIEEEYGDRVNVTSVEDIPAVDVQEVVERLIDEGNEYIVGNTFAFEEPMMEIAEEHSDIMFVHCASPYNTAENFTSCWGKMYEGQYLQGVLAGHMTESNILGYVAPHPVPSVIDGINAFTLGAQSVNPDIETRVVWTDEWHDPSTEREAAMSVIDVGADVIATRQDSPAVPQAAEERGVYVSGYNQPAEEWAPNTILSSTIWDWPEFYVEDVGNALDGSWESRQYFGGLEDGLVKVTEPSDQVPDEARDDFEEARQAIVDGDLDPYQGPIRNQDGELVVPEGEVLPQEDINSIDFLVEGVQGSL